MITNCIELCEKSILQVIAICDKVRHNLPNNQKSVDMAEGIAGYVEEKGFVSDKQAVWICRNAGYWKMKRPAELVNSAANHVLSDDVAKEILRRLRRIEKRIADGQHAQ
jgi:hypothetical protein